MVLVFALRSLAQLDADQGRDAGALHGDAVEHVGDLHRALAVRDHDELRVVGHRADRLGEAADVGLVERRVDLVEQAERARLVLEDARR